MLIDYNRVVLSPFLLVLSSLLLNSEQYALFPISPQQMDQVRRIGSLTFLVLVNRLRFRRFLSLIILVQFYTFCE